MRKLLMIAFALVLLGLYTVTMAEGRPQPVQVQKVPMDGWLCQNSCTFTGIPCYAQSGVCAVGGGGFAKKM